MRSLWEELNSWLDKVLEISLKRTQWKTMPLSKNFLSKADQSWKALQILYWGLLFTLLAPKSMGRFSLTMLQSIYWGCVGSRSIFSENLNQKNLHPSVWEKTCWRGTARTADGRTFFYYTFGFCSLRYTLNMEFSGWGRLKNVSRPITIFYCWITNQQNDLVQCKIRRFPREILRIDFQAFYH